ncbi:rRNA-processing protein cgrA [Neolecta irregularis DAH-3]|uniref:rRNA-processing protein n=1 Tax=Neolecta irregularis (strain DAH-3) TaxID=1198029 RepID=A0A1U7LLD5_NEOID|nr:rRNA-processing protein cgrA [Neolecta irregularis DAH-3]|eukprot:OLL23464.1 rRNA-processing protein cgrA [Neolecta irregularis DAH-3]
MTTTIPGIRKSGKQWKPPSKPSRRTQISASLKTSWSQRSALREKLAQIKSHELRLHTEKLAEKERRVGIIKERRAQAAEKERFALLEAKMHKKKVERMRKKEKRNKMLKER